MKQNDVYYRLLADALPAPYEGRQTAASKQLALENAGAFFGCDLNCERNFASCETRASVENLQAKISFVVFVLWHKHQIRLFSDYELDDETHLEIAAPTLGVITSQPTSALGGGGGAWMSGGGNSCRSRASTANGGGAYCMTTTTSNGGAVYVSSTAAAAAASSTSVKRRRGGGGGANGVRDLANSDDVELNDYVRRRRSSSTTTRANSRALAAASGVSAASHSGQHAPMRLVWFIRLLAQVALDVVVQPLWRALSSLRHTMLLDGSGGNSRMATSRSQNSTSRGGGGGEESHSSAVDSTPTAIDESDREDANASSRSDVGCTLVSNKRRSKRAAAAAAAAVALTRSGRSQATLGELPQPTTTTRSSTAAMTTTTTTTANGSGGDTIAAVGGGGGGSSPPDDDEGDGGGETRHSRADLAASRDEWTRNGAVAAVVRNGRTKDESATKSQEKCKCALRIAEMDAKLRAERDTSRQQIANMEREKSM